MITMTVVMMMMTVVMMMMISHSCLLRREGLCSSAVAHVAATQEAISHGHRAQMMMMMNLGRRPRPTDNGRDLVYPRSLSQNNIRNLIENDQT